jgi:hypothetical protein
VRNLKSADIKLSLHLIWLESHLTRGMVLPQSENSLYGTVCMGRGRKQPHLHSLSFKHTGDICAIAVLFDNWVLLPYKWEWGSLTLSSPGGLTLSTFDCNLLLILGIDFKWLFDINASVCGGRLRVTCVATLEPIHVPLGTQVVELEWNDLKKLHTGWQFSSLCKKENTRKHYNTKIQRKYYICSQYLTQWNHNDNQSGCALSWITWLMEFKMWIIAGGMGILYILKSNPHLVFATFLNKKKLVRASNPHLSFNRPLPTGRLFE